MRDRTKLLRYDIQIKEREDGWWSIIVPALPDVTTQTASLHDVDHLARHAIGQWLEVSPDLIKTTIVS